MMKQLNQTNEFNNNSVAAVENKSSVHDTSSFATIIPPLGIGRLQSSFLPKITSSSKAESNVGNIAGNFSAYVAREKPTGTSRQSYLDTNIQNKHDYLTEKIINPSSQLFKQQKINKRQIASMTSVLAMSDEGTSFDGSIDGSIESCTKELLHVVSIGNNMMQLHDQYQLPLQQNNNLLVSGSKQLKQARVAQSRTKAPMPPFLVCNRSHLTLKDAGKEQKEETNSPPPVSYYSRKRPDPTVTTNKAANQKLLKQQVLDATESAHLLNVTTMSITSAKPRHQQSLPELVQSEQFEITTTKFLGGAMHPPSRNALPTARYSAARLLNNNDIMHTLEPKESSSIAMLTQLPVPPLQIRRPSSMELMYTGVPGGVPPISAERFALPVTKKTKQMQMRNTRKLSTTRALVT